MRNFTTYLHRLRTICVGISGGVDSSVAAHLVKEKGVRVIGVHMTNWDTEEEDGSGVRNIGRNDEKYQNYCEAQREAAYAKDVCDALGIEFHRVSFVQDYWNDVFQGMIEGYQRGITPNPDVLCNRMIKFTKFREYCTRQFEADFVATGHYARLDSHQRLLRGIDPSKDQSYFLSMVDSSCFNNVLFPLGSLYKSQVRQLAQELQLPTRDRKDSTGLCFVGKRRFDQFLQQYIPQKPGFFIDVDGRNLPGNPQHKGQTFYTIGQRASISVCGKDPMFVIDRDPVRNTVTVVPGTNHPCLFSHQATVGNISWTTGEPPDLSVPFECFIQVRYRNGPVNAAIVKEENKAQSYRIIFEQPVRALAPGQYAAIYGGQFGEWCLGAGEIQKIDKSPRRNKLANNAVYQ